MFQICISEQGAVSSAKQLSSTRYADFDARLRDAMLRWRYRPYTVDGRPIPVCGVVTFIYVLPIPEH